MRARALAGLVLVLVLAARAAAADQAAPDARFNLHYQATVATQTHPGFPAQYSGQNSLASGSEWATSVVMDLFLGARLWRGGEAYFQPELAGGRGLSGTLGVGAFPSGEVYRVGNPAPAVIAARLFLRQRVGLGGGAVSVEAGPNELGGLRDRDTLTFTFGKFTTGDIVDDVPVSSDPHTRFTSWGLWASAAYDYPADVRGYTWGAAADLSLGSWSLRGGVFLEPTVANGPQLNRNIGEAHGLALELERRFTLWGRPGAVRALGFLNVANMGSYRQAIAEGVQVSETRAVGRTKQGFAATANQQLGASLSVFLRVSWNDGATESWAFTEIDRSVAAGAVQGGAPWGRPDDEAGLGLVVSGLSAAHRDYLAGGGYGFIIGDGALHYGPEILLELYYRVAITREVSLVATYQPIVNPAYNQDRGPVHVFTGRAHVAF
jgi:high affinity Mn2+ porin